MLKDFRELSLPDGIVNFLPSEFACPCCGEVYEDYAFYEKVQNVRSLLRKSVSLNSCHRCLFHNFEVGGTVRSEHLENAADISLVGLEPVAVLQACLDSGFTGFGFYSTFLHVDCGRKRFWASQFAKETWQGLTIQNIPIERLA